MALDIVTWALVAVMILVNPVYLLCVHLSWRRDDRRRQQPRDDGYVPTNAWALSRQYRAFATESSADRG